jgi:hypothetical protein
MVWYVGDTSLYGEHLLKRIERASSMVDDGMWGSTRVSIHVLK